MKGFGQITFSQSIGFKVKRENVEAEKEKKGEIKGNKCT